MKKALSILLVLCVCTSFAMANGQKDGGNTGSTASVSNNLTAPGTFPIAKEKVTISIARTASTDGAAYSENYFTKLLEAKTNIHINWVELPASSFKESINLMFVSGDIADMIVTGAGVIHRMSKTEETQFGGQGLIIPLENLIKTQSVWFKKALEGQPTLEKYITTPDGHIYALPNIADGYHVTYAQKMWINTSWLKKLGLEMPKNPEEYYQVLKAFKTRDPNGNGKADEIPLSSVKSGANVELYGFLMNPFSYFPGPDQLYLQKGKVVLACTQPGFADGMKYLNKLYSENLINKESFTQTTQNQVNLNESGDVPVVGSFPAMHVAYAANLSASTRWHQYNSVPPLVGANGKAIATYLPYTTRYQTGFATITKACKNPEAAFRMLDYLYSEEAVLAATYGREGIEWQKAPAGEKGLDGRPAKYKAIKVDTKLPEFQNIAWGQSFPGYKPKEFEFSWAMPQDPYDPAVAASVGRLRVFYMASKPHEAVAQTDENTLPPLYYPEANIEELTLLKTTIEGLYNEMLVRFITGDLNVDKDWANFQKQLKDVGLDRYLEINQMSYDKQYKKK